MSQWAPLQDKKGRRKTMGTIATMVPIAAALLFLIPSVASASTIKAPIINLGLVGHWTFDGKDTYNGRISDVSGSANHGSASGIATSTFYDDGVIGQAGNFDGTDDYVSVANTTTLAPGSGNFTFAGWVKSVGPVNVTQYIYWDAVGDAQNRPSIQFALSSSDGKLYGLIRDASGNQVTVSGAGSVISAQNTWRHVVLVLSGKTLTLYVDGSSIGSNTNNSLGAIDTGSAQANLIGGNASVGGPVANFFNGKIDDVRIYNRALSAAEITRLYNIGRPVTTGVSNSTGQLTSGLVGHWTFDGKNTYNGRIDDISGQANHGSATSIATSTFYTDGVIGQAGNFDGVDDYVNTADINSLDGATAITASAWIKEESLITRKAIVVKWDYQTQGNFGFETGESAGKLTVFLATSLTDDGSGSRTDTTNAVLTAGKWHHVSFVFDGSQTGDSNRLKIYVDGSSVATTQGAGAVPAVLTSSTATVKIGLFGGSLTRYFNGSIDDVRVYNRALSAAEITRLYNMGRPTAVGDYDKYFNNVVLLMNMNGANNSTTFTDSSRSAHTVTSYLGTTKLSTALYKFATASGLMTGGHGLYLDGGTDFTYGTADFTIEFWFNMTGGSGSIQNLYDGRDSYTGVAPRIYKSAGEKLVYWFNTVEVIVGTTNVTQNVWHHVALSRHNGSTRLFLDGVQEGSTYTDSNSYVTAASRPAIGVDGAFGGGYITGYLDDYRITKGVARYKSNFTPPANQLPSKRI